MLSGEGGQQPQVLLSFRNFLLSMNWNKRKLWPQYFHSCHTQHGVSVRGRESQGSGGSILVCTSLSGFLFIVPPGKLPSYRAGKRGEKVSFASNTTDLGSSY